jgi:hypothetical protein
MKGSFQLADLQVTLDGSMKELAQAQGVEREFRRACRRLRTQSGAENVFFRVDTGLEGENGSFHKFRLRSYAPDSPEVYTIDCGITDENPLGIYVGWNAPIEIYNRETEQVRTIDPETGEVTEGRGSDSSGGGSAANPSGDGRASSTRQNGREQHASEKVYDQSARSGPSPEQAARSLTQKAQKHPDDTLAGEAQMGGTTLGAKLRGLAEYCDRDSGYVSRILDSLQLSGLEQVAVGQVQTVAQMMLDEEVLRQNESFDPDDDLPF